MVAIPTNADNMPMFDMLIEIAADKAINGDGLYLQWESANEKMKGAIENLKDKQLSKADIEELEEKIYLYVGTATDSTYRQGFTDGIKFLVEAMK